MAGTERLGKAVLELITDSASFFKDLDQADKRLGATGKQVVALGGSMKSFGKDLTSLGTDLTKLSLPILAIGAGALKASIDFESGFAGVRKTVDGVVDGAGNLTAAGQEIQDGLRAMSQRIPVSINDLNGVAEAAGQLGIKKEDILQFTEVMAGLGVTTNLTADEAATATAQIQNIFGAAGKNVDRFGATLVALGNNGASTEKDIIAMGLRIAGAGHQVGLTQDQVLAFANALSSVGINAEAGGGAMSRVFLKINDAVMDGGDKLDEFARVSGMSADAFKTAWERDAAGATVSFIDGIGRLKKEGENVNATIEGLVGKNIILKDTLLRASGAGDLLRDSLSLGAKAWQENSALTNEQSQRFRTLASQTQLVWNQLNDVAITIGNVLAPVVRDLLEWVKPLIASLGSVAQWFGTLPGPIQTTAVVIGGLVAALGPFLMGLGVVVSTVGSALTVLAPLGAALAGLASGPVLAIGAALVGLAAIWATWGDDITRVTGEAVQGVKHWLVDWWQDSILRSVVELFSEFVGLHLDNMARAIDTLRSYGPAVKAALIDEFWPVLDAVKGALAVFTTWWETTKTAVAGIVKGLVTVVRTNWENLTKGFSYVKSGLDTVTGWFRSARGQIAGTSTGEVPATVREIANTWQTLPAAMAEPTKAAVSSVSSQLGTLKTSTTSTASSMVAQLAAVRKEVAGLTDEQRANIQAGLALGSSVKEIAKAVGVSEEAVKRYKEQLAETEKTAKAAAQAHDKFVDSVKRVTTSFPPFAASIKDAGAELHDLSSSTLKETADATKAAADATKAWADDNTAYLAPALKDARREIGEAQAATEDLGTSIRTNLKGALASIPDLLTQAFTGGGGISGALKAIGTQIANSVLGPLMKNLSAAGKLASGVGSTVAGAIGAQSDQTASMIGSLAGSIGGAALMTTQLGVAMTAAMGSTVALGVATAGIGAAAVGVYLLAKHWFTVSEEVKKAREEVEKFEDAIRDNLTEQQKAEAGGERWKEVLIGVRDTFTQVGLTAYDAQRLVAQMWDTDHPDRSREAVAAIGVAYQALAEKQRVVSEGTEEANGLFADLEAAAADLGNTMPDALRPGIDKLVEMGVVSDDTRKRLGQIGNEGEISVADMKKAAEEFGISIDSLGPRFKQQQLTEESQRILKGINLLSAGGTDANVVLNGMRDEIQGVVTDSRKFGTQIPENMKPYIQSLIDAGDLVDENGNRLTDVSQLQFGPPIEDQWDKIAKKLDELIDKVSKGLAGAIVNIPDGRFNIQGVYTPPTNLPTTDTMLDNPQVELMADGGLGKVTKPTLFLAGEAGPEEYAFSGAGRTFGRMGNQEPIIVHSTLLVDGRRMAESTVQHMPAVLARAGVG